TSRPPTRQAIPQVTRPTRSRGPIPTRPAPTRPATRRPMHPPPATTPACRSDLIRRPCCSVPAPADLRFRVPCQPTADPTPHGWRSTVGSVCLRSSRRVDVLAGGVGGLDEPGDHLVVDVVHRLDLEVVLPDP